MKKKHKYTCIAKVGDDHFVKYRLSDLVKFAAFLDDKHSDWRWFNVFDKETKKQIGNFTRNKRPTTKSI